ncbi:type I polyketide synthase [Nocardia africana]|uniref:Erythronolide synthase, modules 3 and 4 n=1 Tax=Nocardia africana TaxID=134964 RepID=A0A378X345_9NOCA|nr:type I polyketide synthase [Nocardia africana]MCC3317283.1 type I polyketide synthase [Nocardia africana]SUA48016.1 Erythronolide synthase, modules 3 and 4 [Nocardia africana]
MSAAGSESASTAGETPDREQRIAAALRAARERLAAPRPAEPIAIVGIGCRFPGGITGPDTLWDVVAGGVDATGEQPGDRWDVQRFYDPDPDKPGTIYTTRGGFLDAVDMFDADFFGISPREAHAMDPQQRLLLEIAWEAVENAGIAPQRLRGSDTGLFVGFSWRDYDRIAVADRPEAMNAYAGLGNTPSIAVGRVAYTLDLHGPVSLVDTACSSSLVAVHQAVQSLRNGDCSTALAGGVNLILSPLSTMFCCRIRALSPDGRCKTFDASADGYGRAEGAALVVLKRLSQAQRDGDRTYAVIRGSAVNHDGRTGGLTVPNARAQEAVVRAALRAANIEPAQVNYIEAHGTGTALGDPIEIGALNSVFGAARAPLWVGSIKSNVGHAETAAGIAGLIKAALAVQRGAIPPTLHVREPNPRIDWASGSARVVTETTPWPAGSRIAGVSSFGFSGTNAHVVVEQPPVAVESATAVPSGLLTLSARSDEALRAQARRFALALRTVEPSRLESVCATANLGRNSFEHRLAVVAGSTTAMAAALDAHTAGQRQPAVVTGHVPRGRAVRAALLIGHRGPGVEPLDRESYTGSGVFRAAVDECLDATSSRESFRTALFAGLAPHQAQRVPGLADALAFVHRYATTRQLLAFGLRPAAVLGVGVGEYVTAAITGILEPAVALRASVSTAALLGERAVARTGDRALLDAVLRETGARLCGHFGDRYLLEAGPGGREPLLHRLRTAGIAATTHAELRDHVGTALADPGQPGDPEFTVVSAHTGARLGREAADPAYWSSRPLWPAQLDRAFGTLLELDCTVFTEVAGATLTELGSNRRTASESRWFTTGTTRGELIRCTAGLFAAGAVDDLRDLHGTHYPRITLPTYPFQRRRYWVEASGATHAPDAARTATLDGAEPGDGRGTVPDCTVPGPPVRTGVDATPSTAPVAGAVESARPALSEADLFLLRRRVHSVVTGSIRQVFQMPDSDPVDLDTPLQELGFDSLMAIELRTVLGRALALPIEAAFAFEFPTATAQIAELTARLADAPTRAPAPAAEPAMPESATPAASTELEHHNAAGPHPVSFDIRVSTTRSPLDGLSESDLIALARAEVAALEEVLR